MKKTVRKAQLDYDDEELMKAIGVDIALLVFLYFFLRLTVGDVNAWYPPIISLVVAVIWYVKFYGTKPREEWDSIGMQFFDLAPEQSDIVKALSLRAPLVGILLAVLTYFWEFLIPVLNVLYIQQLGIAMVHDVLQVYLQF